MPYIRHLFISPAHNYFGHHDSHAGDNPAIEVPKVQCVSGRGIVGDRFFDFKPNYKGQITFFSWENLVSMWNDLGIPVERQNPGATRRNVIIEGLDLDAIVDEEFELQGVRFYGSAECSPCYWMNSAIHPQAEAWMKGRGGLRARILSDGFLHTEDAPL